MNGGVQQATVTGLTNSTPYTFTVHATNSHGNSPESAASGANTPLANLIFGDDFNGVAGGPLSPCWMNKNRDGDQSNNETQYHLSSQVALDGSSHVTLTAAAGPYTAQTYNDSNPPYYTGGGLVTRPYISGSINWVYPGQITTTQGMAVSGFSQPGFNFLYGITQVNFMAPDLGGTDGYPGVCLYGSQMQQAYPYDPDNVGTANWPYPGSEEIDFGNFDGSLAHYFATEGYYSGGIQNLPNVGPAVSNASTTYHTYEVDWSASGVTWKLDGTQTASYSVYIPAGAMYLEMENAIQGSAVVFTQPVMSIDWVRIFHN